MSTYAMLAVMRRAPPGMMHQYLALYFTACMIPGLAPIALGWLLDRWPGGAMLLIFMIAASSAVAFYLVEPSNPQNAPAMDGGAVPAIESS
jgi:hypothetical protein